MQRANLTQHIFTTYYAPRGRARIYELGIQIAQQYLSPFDQIIGIIGEAGSGKSLLIKGMFPGLELTNDDDGVNVRPLPLLDQDDEMGFFTPHTYHIDIRFEMGFTQLPVLVDAIRTALSRGKRVIIEHFDLIYPLLGHNAHLLIGVGEQIMIARPNLFGPLPNEVRDAVYASLPYRLMSHSAEELCEYYLPKEDLSRCRHADVKHGFILVFPDHAPTFDLKELEAKVQRRIDEDLPISYVDESHVSGKERGVCRLGKSVKVSQDLPGMEGTVSHGNKARIKSAPEAGFPAHHIQKHRCGRPGPDVSRNVAHDRKVPPLTAPAV